MNHYRLALGSTSTCYCRFHSLKTKLDSAERGPIALRRLLVLAGIELRNFACGLLQESRESCTDKGHALPRNGWQAGRVPTCPDCGDLVRFVADLRQAS